MAFPSRHRRAVGLMWACMPSVTTVASYAPPSLVSLLTNARRFLFLVAVYRDRIIVVLSAAAALGAVVVAAVTPPAEA